MPGIDIIGTLRRISSRVRNIFDITNAGLTLTETGGTLTTDGTEQTIWVQTTPMGVFKPLTFLLNTTALALGDTIVIRTFYQIVPGGALVPSDEVTFAGPSPPAQRLKEFILKPNRYGVEITLEQTVGAPVVDFDWEVFYEV